ncbi:cg30-2 [Sucra jujuba nucleopolyhedrovirus]|uniref:Cg30-2 n=1 Tax=Sucra jujuba nucleopolyhedrovirus TaxID=1563660 RepID=A0A097P8U1_9ABAC|nr:cg30-2 [Sucra jujuba nucleopolyhedrovirus]AIU41247.1 cg30-2 [Sucra jujuba nucleopolyhedrovirus]
MNAIVTNSPLLNYTYKTNMENNGNSQNVTVAVASENGEASSGRNRVAVSSTPAVVAACHPTPRSKSPTFDPSNLNFEEEEECAVLICAVCFSKTSVPTQSDDNFITLPFVEIRCAHSLCMLCAVKLILTPQNEITSSFHCPVCRSRIVKVGFVHVNGNTKTTVQVRVLDFVLAQINNDSNLDLNSFLAKKFRCDLKIMNSKFALKMERLQRIKHKIKNEEKKLKKLQLQNKHLLNEINNNKLKIQDFVAVTNRIFSVNNTYGQSCSSDSEVC